MFEQLHELFQLKPIAIQHARHSRFHQQDGFWYFNTREGINIGPFPNKADANFAAEHLATRSEWPNQDQLNRFIDGLILLEKKH